MKRYNKSTLQYSIVGIGINSSKLVGHYVRRKILSQSTPPLYNDRGLELCDMMISSDSMLIMFEAWSLCFSLL